MFPTGPDPMYLDGTDVVCFREFAARGLIVKLETKLCECPVSFDETNTGTVRCLK